MSLANFELRTREDPSFLARFIVNPKEALVDAGISLDSVADVKQLEMFARNAQEQLRSAARLSGFEVSAEADWGIGINCCNSKSLRALDVNAIRALERLDADRMQRILPKLEQ